jgi:hypothetical protein
MQLFQHSRRLNTSNIWAVDEHLSHKNEGLIVGRWDLGTFKTSATVGPSLLVHPLLDVANNHDPL